MVYNWDDLQENRFEVVEWGDNVRRTRRERVLGNIMSPEDRKKRLITSAVVVISTIVALGIAVTVALTLVGPMPEPADGGGGAYKAEGMGSLPSLTSMKEPTTSPIRLRPTTPPTIAKSQMPSIAISNMPSVSPSELRSMVPSTAPTVFCVDEPGTFENHVGEHVSCDWFATVNTISFVDNCGKTALGRACQLSCRFYNSCVIATESPSSQPSFTSSPSISRVPTPGHPNNITLLATSDAMVNEGEPNATLGSSSWLKIIAAAAVPAANASLEQESNGIVSPYVRESDTSSDSNSIAAMVRDYGKSALVRDGTKPQSIAAMVREYSINATAPTTIAPVDDSSNSTDRGTSARGFTQHSAVDDSAFHVLIRFNISAHDETRLVLSANLLLNAANNCTSGVYLTQTSTNWNESSITWNNAPTGDGNEINRLGNITRGHMYSVNVTSVFTMPISQEEKALSFRLYPLGIEECLFESKENTSGGGPKLLIVYDDV
ncbi:hypothetical protein ACHAWU_008249 [Discostella pseudostelligera]|uniref:Carbohydrate-binding module family 96 domain-containing protein n=1 Tax=Discostella pseudostelligera TaxID=259834 RepID=A0ABD3M374_9STRA